MHQLTRAKGERMKRFFQKLQFNGVQVLRQNILKGLMILAATGMAPGNTSSALAQEEKPLQTVEQLDVQRYLGRWYEIARLPQIFQPFCTKVTADYSLLEDGNIRVVNRCRIADPNIGLPISIRGKAYPVDASNSRLKVEFFGGFSVGDYWVLELDPEYQWAMVGDPRRFSLYILSRQPDLDEAVVANLIELAEKKHGYANLDRLIRTRQK